MSELSANLAHPFAPAEAPSTTDKALTQLSLLGLSAVDGVKKNLHEASGDIPVFGAKLAGATAAGAAITRAVYVHPISRIAIVPTMTALFGLDLLSRGAQTTSAMIDTWDHPDNFEKNKVALEPVLGGGIFDYTAYGLAGSVGSKAMHNRFDTKLLYRKMSEQWSALPETSTPIYKTTLKVPTPTQVHDPNSREGAFYLQHRPSVVHIRTASEMGSGFYVDKDLVATNYHVVRGKLWLAIEDHAGNKTYGSLISRDKATDLALVRISKTDEMTPKPVQLGNTDELKAGATIFNIGHTLGLYRAPFTEGKFSKSLQSDVGPRKISEVETRLAQQFGNSGSPMFDETGKVVSVVSFGSTSRAYGPHSEHLKALIEATKHHMDLPEGHWINVRTSASGSRTKGEPTTITTIASVRDRLPLAARFHEKASEAWMADRANQLTWRTGALAFFQIPSPNQTAIRMVGAESYAEQKIKQHLGKGN